MKNNNYSRQNSKDNNSKGVMQMQATIEPNTARNSTHTHNYKAGVDIFQESGSTSVPQKFVSKIVAQKLSNIDVIADNEKKIATGAELRHGSRINHVRNKKH